MALRSRCRTSILGEAHQHATAELARWRDLHDDSGHWSSVLVWSLPGLPDGGEFQRELGSRISAWSRADKVSPRLVILGRKTIAKSQSPHFHTNCMPHPSNLFAYKLGTHASSLAPVYIRILGVAIAFIRALLNLSATASAPFSNPYPSTSLDSLFASLLPFASASRRISEAVRKPSSFGGSRLIVGMWRWVVL